MTRSSRLLAVPVVALSLATCTPVQLETGQGYLERVAGVCETLNAIAPGTWAAPYVVDCRTAAGIARLALDPTIQTWLQSILAQLRGLVWFGGGFERYQVRIENRSKAVTTSIGNSAILR